MTNTLTDFARVQCRVIRVTTPPETPCEPTSKLQAAAVLEDLDAFRQSLEEQDSVLTGVELAA